jgi:hypothetical protein
MENWLEFMASAMAAIGSMFLIYEVKLTGKKLFGALLIFLGFTINAFMYLYKNGTDCYIMVILGVLISVSLLFVYYHGNKREKLLTPTKPEHLQDNCSDCVTIKYSQKGQNRAIDININAPKNEQTMTITISGSEVQTLRET